MKQVLLFLSLLCIQLLAQAQPQGFHYQAVARDGNQLIINLSLGVKIRLIDKTPSGQTLYEEIHEVKTNEVGVFNLEIGMGRTLSGEFDSVAWENETIFLEVSIDPEGGSNYQSMGMTRLLSVPYAMYAREAGNGGGEGIPGPPGPKGERGERGEQGERGEIGEQGPKGERGERGEQGERGEIGEQGPKGERGERGEQGERGEIGEQGPKGERGERGEQGERGEMGEQGPKGERGERGEQGERGEMGEQGPKGERGERGEQGERGEKGEDGDMLWEEGEYNFADPQKRPLRPVVFQRKPAFISPNGLPVEGGPPELLYLVGNEEYYPGIRFSTFEGPGSGHVRLINSVMEIYNGGELKLGSRTGLSIGTATVMSLEGAGGINIQTNNELNVLAENRLLLNGNNGIEFLSGTHKLTFDSDDGFLGLGRDPEATLHLHEGRPGRTSTTLKITNSEVPVGGFHRGLELTLSGTVASLSNGEEGGLNFRTDQATRMSINSDGKIGIGTTIPTHTLHVRHQAVDPETEGLLIERRNGATWQWYVDEEGNLELYRSGALVGWFNLQGEYVPNFVDRRTAGHESEVGLESSQKLYSQAIENLESQIVGLKATLHALKKEIESLKMLTPTEK